MVMTADALLAAARAALDETERIALAAGERSRNWHADGAGQGRGAVEHDGKSPFPIVYDEGYPTEAESVHIAHNDPAAVLRRVKADRELLDLAQRLLADAHDMEQEGDMDAALGYGSYAFAFMKSLARGLGINPDA